MLKDLIVDLTISYLSENECINILTAMQSYEIGCVQLDTLYEFRMLHVSIWICIFPTYYYLYMNQELSWQRQEFLHSFYAVDMLWILQTLQILWSGKFHSTLHSLTMKIKSVKKSDSTFVV